VPIRLWIKIAENGMKLMVLAAFIAEVGEIIRTFFKNFFFQIGIYNSFLLCEVTPIHALARSRQVIGVNKQGTFAARSNSINTVYYSFFKPSASREWVQGRELQQSYSGGE
jgi:hypothetical protein